MSETAVAEVPPAGFSSAAKPGKLTATSWERNVRPGDKKNVSLSSSNQAKATVLARVLGVASPANVDDFLSHLLRAVSTRSGFNATLLFAAYSARLASSVLDLLARTILRASAKQLLKLAFTLPPDASVVVAPVPRLATVALGLAERMRALVEMLGDWRNCNRMWELLTLYSVARNMVVGRSVNEADEKSGAEEKPSEDSLDATFKVVDLALNTGYVGCEAFAWLATKRVIPLSQKTQDRLMLISCRSWGVSVVVDLTRMLVERARRKPSDDVEAEKEWASEWSTNFMRALCWLPLTVHWGFRPFLADEVVSVLAAGPCFGYMRDLWRATA